MKRILLVLLAILVIGGGVAAWIFLGSGTGFSADKEFLYISSKATTKEAVMDSIRKRKIVSNESAFNFLANQMNYWKNIRAGKYEISKGTSILNIVRMLRNGKQSPVNLVITKLRTKEDFARFTANRLEFDSADMMSILNDADTMKSFNADVETAMWNVLPDTYTYFWNTTPGKVYAKIFDESKKFWSAERKQKAEALGLSPLQVYILASIVEEETNNLEEKDTIASVYINRIKKGMALGADPTIKFALKDFGIKWIRGDMLRVQSPYNTYINRGLPPGPICTPSKKTIDAVLSAPPTNYLFFVANSDFSGTHLFSATYQEHLTKARAYQEEDRRRREAREKSTP